MLTILLLLSATIGYGQISINEALTSSDIDYIDGISYDGDWIELYNSSDQPVQLSDYSIADESLESPYTLPDTIVAAQSVILFLASDDTLMEPPFIGLPFRLSSGGETITLYKNGTAYEVLELPELDTDQAYGRMPDGIGDFIKLNKPTPGRRNIFSAEIELSHEPGFYDDEILFKAEVPEGYSLQVISGEGEEPFPINGLLVQKQFADKETGISYIPTTPNEEMPFPEWKKPSSDVYKADIIRIVQYYNDIVIDTFEYYFFVGFKSDLNSVSIKIDEEDFFDHETGIYHPGRFFNPDNVNWSGNYFARGRSWEREGSFTYYINGTKEFHTDIGLRIHGGLTRGAAQKSLRLYARNDYGSEDFPKELINPNRKEDYKRIVLKTSMGEWGRESTTIRNTVTQYLAKKLNLDYYSDKYVNVFINGEYWGVQLLEERFDEEFLSGEYDIKEDNINLLSSYLVEVDNGSNASYQKFMDWLEIAETESPLFPDQLSEYIDINNFLNYTILETYLANYDWPSANIKFWNSDSADIKFRWLPFDFDAGINSADLDMQKHINNTDTTVTWPNRPASTLIFRRILSNPEIRLDYYRMYEKALGELFIIDDTQNHIDSLAAVLEPEMEMHIARWGHFENIEEWRENVEKVKDFFDIRSCFALQHLQNQYPEIEPLEDCVLLSVQEDPHSNTSRSVKSLYPNPAFDNINIILGEAALGDVDIEIFNSIGNAAWSGNIIPVGNAVNINLSNLISGFYIVKLHYKSNSGSRLTEYHNFIKK
jgi:hypothetical protein